MKQVLPAASLDLRSAALACVPASFAEIPKPIPMLRDMPYDLFASFPRGIILYPPVSRSKIPRVVKKRYSSPPVEIK
ncbi:hypothetical protein D3C76_1783020 [compost metagenome]